MGFRFLIFLCCLILAFSFAVYAGMAEELHSRSGVILLEGKNQVEIDRAVLVKEIVILNPEIEYVSYYDEFLNKQVAYVNVFGGVGDNFLIEPGRIYEFSVRKKIELVT